MHGSDLGDGNLALDITWVNADTRCLTGHLLLLALVLAWAE